MIFKNNNRDSLFSIIRETIRIFYLVENKQVYFLVFITFIISVIEVLSFTALIPIIYLISNPLPILNNPVLYFVYSYLNFSSNSNFIMFLLICLFLLFIIKNILLLWCYYLQNKFIYAVATDLIQRQITFFYQNDYIDIKNNNSVQYMHFISTTPQEYAIKLLLPFILLLNELLVVTLIVLALLIYYPYILLLLFITVIPLSYLLVHAAKEKLAIISDIKGELEIKSYNLALEAVNGYSDIKLFSKENVFKENIIKSFRKLYTASAQSNLFQLVPRRIIETIVILTICILYAICTMYFSISTPMQLMLILITFATAAYRLMPSINEVLTNMIRMKTSSYILTQMSFITDYSRRVSDESFKYQDNLKLEDVCYNYTGQHNLVLNNINLSIKKGEFVVLTGESGSGKTTIGRILAGFVKQEKGSYKIDTQEVKYFNEIRNLLAYVTQDFYLFDKSLLENIAIGEDAENIDMVRIYKVIEAANLSDFVNNLPTGLHYKVGEMGARLSGGQKQRIAIARALYKKAQFMILDEITSSLDTENEVEILNTLYKISKTENISVLLITHRISSLKNFDKWYFLENGILSLKNIY